MTEYFPSEDGTYGNDQCLEDQTNQEADTSFEAAADSITEHFDSLGASDNESLQLYSLYKRITVGNRPAGSRPGYLNPVARAKYDAWTSQESLSVEEAKYEYISTASFLLNRARRSGSQTLESGQSSDSKVSVVRNPKTPKPSKSYWGILPRGELDITYSDLCFALGNCLTSFVSFSPSNKATRKRCESNIEALWKQSGGCHDNVIVSLSIRSAFDLYLQARNYSPGSEIIMSAIQIEGMVRIAAEAHGLIIIPVDCSIDSLSPSLEDVLGKINKRTVAVMVVHPFGAIGSLDLSELSLQLESYQIDLIEDCAECFSGLSKSKFDSYVGSPSSDVTLFSFGSIKTATALGGGIATIKCNTVARKMKRLQNQYTDVPTSAFFLKVMKTFVLVLISKNPLLFGLIVVMFESVGCDLEAFVTASLRGFSTGKGVSPAYIRQLLSLIRRRNSVANLELLYRRLSTYDGSIVSKRIKRCSEVAALIGKQAPNVILPGQQAKRHLYWLFPIIVNDADGVCRKLMKEGYDVPRGTSQLGCIDKYINSKCKDQSECPKASEMMSSVLYVPIASIDMSNKDITRLVKALSVATSATARPASTNTQSSWLMTMCILPFFLMFYPQCIWSVSISLLSIATKFAIIGGALTLSAITFFCWSRPRNYCNDSQAVARYVGIHEKASSAHTPVSDDEWEDVLNMDRSPSLAEHFERPKQALLTGATGFVGSMLLRDLLLYRKKLGIEGGIVVLSRAKKKVSAKERISALLDHDMFEFLSSDEKASLIHVVEGDVAKPNMGMKTAERANLNHLSFSHVIHCAASVKFNQSFEGAAVTNITSSLQLQQLAKELNAKFVYMSTAFVHGGNIGSKNEPLPEDLFSLGKYDADDIYQSMLGSQSLASSALNDLRFPNTYTISKCVCEHLLLRDKESDTTIIRPCIVGPAYSSPWEGWAGDSPSTLVAGACLFLKYPNTLWKFGPTNVPVIPVDIVTKFTISIAFSVSISIPSLRDGTEFSSSVPKYTIDSDERVANKEKRIYTAAWNPNSSRQTQFTWEDFGFATIQVGSLRGHHSRFGAQVIHLVETQLLWKINISFQSFNKLHQIFTKIPYELLLSICQRISPKNAKLLERLSSVVDLPLLFWPFTQSTFFFQSDLTAPSEFSGERYMTSCILAADLFLAQLKARKKDVVRRCSNYVVGGRLHQQKTSDMWWALTQPSGNFFVRLIGFILIKILRKVCNEVTVDLPSFSAQARSRSANSPLAHIILVPTHRSLFDFLLVSYVCFMVPELGIPIPFICAADEFSSLPLLGWLARGAKAFFIKRGKGVDPQLSRQVTDMKRGGPISFEVFMEGTRSRDRRFLKPKTGFFRCLRNTDDEHIILPLTINYERVPEQATFVNETTYCQRRGLLMGDLFRWLKDVFGGNINLGRIHITAATPVPLTRDSNLQELTMHVQMAQQRNICVSEYHTEASATALALPLSIVKEALHDLGCKFWGNDALTRNNYSSLMPPTLPDCQTELLPIMFHWAHLLAPFLVDSYPKWAEWLNPCEATRSLSCVHSESNAISMVVNALTKLFDEADRDADRAINMLARNGFIKPSRRHVLQYLQKDTECLILSSAAVAMKLPISKSSQDVVIADNDYIDFDEDDRRHRPVKALFPGSQCAGSPVSEVDKSDENFGAWGYKDSGFILNVDKKGRKIVSMKGDRYRVSGKPLSRLVPFLESEMNVTIDPLRTSLPSFVADPVIDLCEISNCGLAKLDLIVTGGTSIYNRDRCRHGSGQSQADIFSIRRGSLQHRRFPDVVVWPDNASEVSQLVALAAAENWCLIPFGGGTNVSHATWCPSKEREPRPIISVDTKRLCRIFWVNKEDGLAHVEAGITGGELASQLEKFGVTMGHEPDSIEFSTLGGWIATKASGMKRSRYGNIEDIIKDVSVVGAKGVLWQESESTGADITKINKCSDFGRVSTGIDLRSLMLGSEGGLGIITSAVIKVLPLPECKEYESVILPSFEDGLHFMKDVATMRQFKPASVRLVDNAQFRLGQVLKGEEKGFMSGVSSNVMKLVASSIYNLEKYSAVSVSITFEGSNEEVHYQKSRINRFAAKNGGVMTGPSVGQAGYDLTFAIAYLRDFAMSYFCLGESFETFVPWSKLEDLISRTKERVCFEHKKRCLPGEPLVSCRVTQIYDEGACIYFYYLMNYEGVQNPVDMYNEVEHCARDEILRQGGSLSHHHGIGKIRGKWMNMVNSDYANNLFKDIKQGIDPENLFGARNGTFFEAE